MNTTTTPYQTGSSGPIPRIVRTLRLLPLLILGLIANPLRADQFGDFTYINNVSHVTITGYTGSGGAVVIPSTIVGLPVTVIGNYAFPYTQTVTSVAIPASVTTLGTGAFRYCWGVTSFTVDAANSSFSSSGGVIFNKMQTELIQYPLSRTGAYSIPGTVTTIGSSAFFDAQALNGITIPSSVTTIGSGAFAYCDGVANVAIPASVISIGSTAFSGSGLLEIVVDGANPNYSSASGVLFNKSGTILLQYPPKKTGSYTIPNTVTEIGGSAFSHCSLSGVTIPEGVTVIRDSGFFNSIQLVSVSIPASVTVIEPYAFTSSWAIQSFTVASMNSNYSSLDGVLFNKARTTLIQYPGGKVESSYVVPSTVSTINYGACGGADFTSITIPASVTYIGPYAFDLCYNLVNATFQGNAPVMGFDVFSYSIPVGFTVYFYSGATGFTTPTWQGQPSQMLTGGGGSALANAVDAPSLTFTTGGSASWASQTVVTHDGIDAAASGDIGNSQESWMETTVTGPGTISFWWAAATDPNDVLGFYVNGVPQSGPISGNIPWAQKTYVLGAGTQTLRWRYSKDFFGDFYSDTTWVDQVVWTPGGGGNPTDLTWSNNGSSITITGYTGSGGAVVIPSTIDGLPVTTIGAYAFDSKFAVTGVAIPSSVTSIGSYAFLSCSSLSNLTIPSSVTSIGFQAFSYCYSLTTVSISSGLTNIGSGAFSGCSSLTSFSVDAANPSYSASAGVLFNKTQTMLIQYPGGKSGGYTIPSSVTSIGTLAFQSSSGLTSVTIPSGVTSIDADAFRGCSILASFSVDVANPSFSSSGGVLFNKAQTILIQYPAGKTGGYSIPSGVTSIGASSFYSCTGLTNVTIPSSTTSIGSFAFYFCTGLTSVTMPLGITNIDSYAFYYCNKLTAVTIPSSVTTIATSAFSYSTLLVSVTFQGNAPATFGSSVFNNTASGFTVYYYSGSTGFTSPTWQGYPAQMLAAGSPFASWASTAGLTGNNALPGAIPFSDGVPNLLKFAFGLNAAGPDVRRMVQGGTVGLPASYLHTSSGTVWRVEYLRRKNSGLTYTPKKSTSLATGSFVPLVGTPVVTDVIGSTEWERVIVDEPYNPGITPSLFTVVEVITPQ